MRIALTFALSLLAAGCMESRTERCRSTYAGTIGADGCRTSHDALRSDGQFKDRDHHCRLWTAYNEPTGRCEGWTDPDGPYSTEWTGMLIVQPDGAANICRGHYSSDPPSCGGGGIVIIEPEQLERLGKPTGSTSGVRWYDRVTVSGRVTEEGLEASEVSRD